MINVTRKTPENKVVELIKSLARKLENLKTDQLTVFVAPNVTSDPASFVDGQMWYNTTSDELKVVKNGTVRTVTTS